MLVRVGMNCFFSRIPISIKKMSDMSHFLTRCFLTDFLVFLLVAQIFFFFFTFFFVTFLLFFYVLLFDDFLLTARHRLCCTICLSRPPIANWSVANFADILIPSSGNLFFLWLFFLDYLSIPWADFWPLSLMVYYFRHLLLRYFPHIKLLYWQHMHL